MISKPHFNKIIYFSILIIGLLILLFFLSFSKTPSFNFTGTAMGTYINQTVYCSEPASVCTDAINSIKELENKISWRIIESDISKINNAKENEYINVSPETLDILDIAIEISKLSKSAFNPVILPLSKLWDFGSPNQHVPADEDIQNTLKYLSTDSLIIYKSNKSVTKKDSHTMIDLGAIGKGTACDTVIKLYKDRSVKAGIICVGGSIGVYGKKNNNCPFKIAIRNPFINDQTDTTFAILNIDSGFISTSGSYEKNFTYNDKFYHHILSSDTGYPVSNDLMSVTVYHSNGTISDILSTACYVLGPYESRNLLNKFNAQALFVNKEKKIIASIGLKDKLNITDKTFIISEWI